MIPGGKWKGFPLLWYELLKWSFWCYAELFPWWQAAFIPTAAYCVLVGILVHAHCLATVTFSHNPQPRAAIDCTHNCVCRERILNALKTRLFLFFSKQVEVADKAPPPPPPLRKSNAQKCWGCLICRRCDGASVTVISASQTSYRHPAGCFNWQVTYCNKWIANMCTPSPPTLPHTHLPSPMRIGTSRMEGLAANVA